MADFSRVGRNNKNRGRSFERDVAKLLGWSRVPYSGGQKEWGSADVVDGFYSKNGYWAAECKTVLLDAEKPLNITIKEKWVKQLIEGEYGGRHGILVVQRILRNAKPGTKRPAPYVIMLADTFNWFQTQLHERILRNTESLWPIQKVCTFSTETKSAKFNFDIDQRHLDMLKRGVTGDYDYMLTNVSTRAGYKSAWYIFRLDDFADIVNKWGIMKFERIPDE